MSINKSPKIASSLSASRNFALQFNMQGAVLTILLAMIIVVPLVSGTDYLQNFGKPLAFEVFGCILLGALAGQISFGKETTAALVVRLKTGPTIGVVGLVLYAAILYVVHQSPHLFELTSRAELFRIFFCGLVYVATALYLHGIGRLQILIDVLLAVGAVVAIISLGSIGLNGSSLVVHGTFGTHETLGSFLLLVLPLALPIALSDLGDQRRQIFAQIVTLLIAAALLMAHTRAAWLGSAVSLFTISILYWLFQAQNKKNMSPTERAAILIGPPLIMAAAVALFVLTSQQGSAIFSRASTLANLNADGSAQVRKQLAHGAIRMIKEKPFFGWGLGRFSELSYGFTRVGQTSDQILQHGATLDNNAHSFYLQFTAEQGLVGLAIFVGMIVLFFISTISALRTMPSGFRKCVVIGALAACTGQLVDAAISPSYNLPAISMFQFLVLGVGTLAAHGLDLPTANPDIPSGQVRRVRKRVSSNARNDEWSKQNSIINSPSDL